MNQVLPAFKNLFKPRAMQHQARFEGILGTALELQMLADNKTIALKAENLILAEIARLERVYSFFQVNSELNRWQAAGCAVPSLDLKWLLELAVRQGTCENYVFTVLCLSGSNYEKPG